MRKVFIILLSAISLSAVAQETIALLEPRVGDGSNIVTQMEKNIIRGELRKAIVNFPGYEAITRSDIDQLMQEQNFQRTGVVSDAQIKKLNELAAADYVCVSTLSKSNTEFYLEAYLVHLESGRMLSPASKYGELTNGKLANMFPACQELARELLGDNAAVSSELYLPEGKYIGEIRNGKPHGKGILYYNESDENGRNFYDGEWRNGIRHGKGVITWKDGSKYEGDWDNGSWNGQGTYYFEDGRVYRGGWKKDVQSGYGVMTLPDGDQYEGNWIDGAANGQGTYYYNDGDKYVGNWKDSERSGYGVLTFSDGSKLECYWLNNAANGQGTYYYNDGDKYVGNLKDGKKSGRGIYYWSNGARLEGNFENDAAHGYCSYYWPDGDVDRGNYVNGKCEGEWTRTKPDGTVYRATYSNNEIIRAWH